ncbi:MAG: family 1 glycosylhydrolase [Candidatus Lokiarchaeota archaeon]|nr:family 1 glycosylhydrolase [Candidatus Lokiarchaeota archaeon]
MGIPLELNYRNVFSSQNFFFGVANAPYLSEGGYNLSNGPKNNYYDMEKSGKIEKSKDACRFWTDYEKHIKLAMSLGLDAFRMGVEWARIQPTIKSHPHSPPEWDYSAVDHYAKMISTLFKYNLEPIITLHHFTHPAWLPKEMWITEDGPRFFTQYALKIVKELNIRLYNKAERVIKNFIVSNEPNIILIGMFISGDFLIEKKGPRQVIKAYDNLFSSYVKVYDGLYNLYEKNNWSVPEVGFNSASQCPYEIDKQFLDLMRLRTFGIEENDISSRFNDLRMAWNKRVGNLAKTKLNKEQYERYKFLIKFTEQIIKPTKFKKTIDQIYRSKRKRKLDYISVNIYEPFMGPKSSLDLSKNPDWWEYSADGEIYSTFIRAYHDFNNNLPIYMGENSLAYRQPIGKKAEPRPDGWTRERYLKVYISEMIKCIKDGIPIKGYLYWSLTDDYEWESFEPRLGLYNYDYINGKIRETDGLGEPAGEIYADLISTLRKGNLKEIVKKFKHTL